MPALALAHHTIGPSVDMTLHRPVMLDESLAALRIAPGHLCVDATYGRGGHSAAMLAALAGRGRLHAFDQDPEACAHAFRTHAGREDFRIHAGNFSTLGSVAEKEDIVGKINSIFFDLGVSSPQLDEAPRGFSFTQDGPLDMRMDPRTGESAAAWLARAPEAEIADVLWNYGDERASRRIARALVAARTQTPITRTAQLAQLILDVHRGPRQKIHPATRSFQAIRIHINRELDHLASALDQALHVLAPGGRLAVLSFHSLEDRVVKRFIRDQPERLEKISREFPSEAECAANPRARSAVLRVAEKRA